MSMKSLLTNTSIMLLMILSCVQTYTAVTMDLLIPLTTSTIFGWSLWELSVITTCCVIVYAVTMFTIVAKIIVGSQRVFRLTVMCMMLSCLALVLMLIPYAIVVTSGSSQINTNCICDFAQLIC